MSKPASFVPRTDTDQPAMQQPAAAVTTLLACSEHAWPGRRAAVVFVSGCPWRCVYCCHPQLQQRTVAYQRSEVLDWLKVQRQHLDSVVFSGGEALGDPRFPEMLFAARKLGFQTGLHTAGIFPGQMAPLLAHLDWVALDIKTTVAHHDSLTGKSNSHWPTGFALELLINSHPNFECRTTWHPDWLSELELLELARELSVRGVKRYALQQAYLPEQMPIAPHPGVLISLSSIFEHFEYREALPNLV
ncbi:anaerobic ribonucleoside-triphosphate reductase activating protein [Burkholderiaceae bacterium DAT-1]|nr:anaerobic ribonucleoside-triphosphate reductase activating protein [Burkholderiaceae bacterium DAT-1]